MAHQKLTKSFKYGQAIHPASIAGANTPIYFDMSIAHRAVFIILGGAWTSDQTVQVRQRLGAAGTEKDITGKVVTLTTLLANTVQTIEVEASEMDVNGGFDRIGLLTAGGTNVLGAAIIRETRYLPPSLVT